MSTIPIAETTERIAFGYSANNDEKYIRFQKEQVPRFIN